MCDSEQFAAKYNLSKNNSNFFENVM